MSTVEQRERILLRHQDKLRALIVQLNRTDGRFTQLRVATVVAGFVAAQVAYSALGQGPMWGVLAVAAVVFGAVVWLHRRMRNVRQRTLIAYDLVGEQLGRLRLDWSALPEGIEVSAEMRTPIEVDFDLIGDRSIHRLIDSAETNGGSNRLRNWLIAGEAEPATIARRQSIVAELRPRWHLRRQLALGVRKLTGGHADWSTAPLQSWLAQSDEDTLSRWLWPLIALSSTTIVLFVLDQFVAQTLPWLATLVLYAAGMIYVNRQASQTFQQASYLRDMLEQMLSVFGTLERYPYQGAPAFKQLCEPFWQDVTKPTKSLKGIVRVVNLMGITQGNPFLALLFNIFFPFSVFLTVRLGREKQLLQERLPLWTDAWYEVEAMASLANFAWLNPHYPFPTIASDGPAFNVVNAGHPLIPRSEKVTNSFEQSQIGGLSIVTGSNMAGKSTFLRTLGVNATLAFAGSVVDAAEMSIQPMRIYSCIKVSDSVTDGFSYFYAEVRRLRGLLSALESAETLPILYFVDEIFRGTNNRERLIGSRSLVKAMAGLSGVGFISTHDLELVHLADDNTHIRNFHFREHIVDEQMAFDYTLREGPSPTTNALKIMRLAGLPIDTVDTA